MSRQTPRKKGHHANNHAHPHPLEASHHKRNRSQHLQSQYQQVVPSDYESDTATYMAHHPPPPKAELANRTNTELNMKVLQRHVPNLKSILSIAANAVVYEIQMKEDGNYGWEKAGIEGTMFVCAQQDNNGAWDGLKGCVFVLNRKGIVNQTVDFSEVEGIESTDQLLTFKLADKEEQGPGQLPRVVGLYIHEDVASTRSTNEALIQEMWNKVQNDQAR